MPRARSSLLEAGLSNAGSGENRLTEVFATVLAENQRLARALFEHLELVAGDRFVVHTQTHVAPGCNVDVTMHSERSTGAHVSYLWSEHKTISGFRPKQREDYLKALDEERGTCPGRLLTITSTPEPASPDWSHMTWQQVGELVDEVGRDWNGSRWRDAAAQPAAPAQERLLLELLMYLEREGFAVVRPFDSEDVAAYERYRSAEKVLGEFVQRVAGSLGAEGPVHPSIRGWWFHVDPPAGNWLGRLGLPGYCEVIIANSGAWSARTEGEPAIGAGYTINPSLEAVLRQDSDFLNQLDGADFTLGKYRGWVRCFKTRPLSDFLGEGQTLDHQALACASWAAKAIAELGTLGPLEQPHS